MFCEFRASISIAVEERIMFLSEKKEAEQLLLRNKKAGNDESQEEKN